MKSKKYFIICLINSYCSFFNNYLILQSTTKSDNVDLADRIIDIEKRCLEMQAENEKLLEELNTEREKAKDSSGEIENDNSDIMLELAALKVSEL